MVDVTIPRLDRPNGPGALVLAAPFRAHIVHLQATTGVHWRIIAQVAGVAPGVVDRLLHGRSGRPRPKLARTDAEALLNVTPRALQALAAKVVPADRAHQALLALYQCGIPVARLAEELHLSRDELDAVLIGAPLCTALLAEQLVAAATVVVGDRELLAA